MDIWDILWILSMVFLGFLSVRSLVRFLRKFVKSKKVGIIKVVAGWGLIITEAVGIGLIIFAANRFSVAHKYREKAEEYQQILDKVDGILSGADKIQHLSSSSLQENYAEVEKAIEDLTVSARLLNIFGWYLLMVGISEITSGIASIVLITEEGIVWTNVELPEPFTAVYRDGKIEVDIKANFANKKGVRTFKGTPENLAKFGRFIEWDASEVDAEGQTAPPPDNSNMPT